MASNDKEFRMTKEEVDKLEKAMKNEEFRKLLVEYAQEISDPENKKRYEEEIRQMENERGMDVMFVNPEEGFVVKTTRETDGIKAFVNICYNQHIEKATFRMAEKGDGTERKKGQQWSIPYSLAQPRDDFDRAGKKCVTFDVVFHPDTYKKCTKMPQFKKMVIETALEGIERQLNIKLNKKNLKFPKMKFKGMKQATVIRNKSNENSFKKPNEGITIGDKTIPYPYADQPTCANKQAHKSRTPGQNTSKVKDNNADTRDPRNPEYTILHRGIIDFQNFTNARDSCTSTRPKELVIRIDLPDLKSAGSVELDIFEKQLLLNNEVPPYHLDITLPYPIDENKGSAKFDKSKQQLVVTLLVLPPPPPPQVTTFPDPADEEAGQGDAAQQDPEGSSQAQETDGKGQTGKRVQENEHGPDNGNLSPPNSSTESEVTIDNAHIETKQDISPVDGNPGSTSNDLEKDASVADNSSEDKMEAHENMQGVNDAADENMQDVNDAADDNMQGVNDAADENMQGVNDAADENVLGVNDVDDAQAVNHASGINFELPDLSFPFFKCPSYSYHQDDDTITFVIHESGVTLNNVSLGFLENMCYISFPSVITPHGQPGQDFALYVTFNEGQNLDPDLCDINVAENSLVLTLQKDDSCKGLWDTFKAGPSEENLEERYFVTESNLEAMMEEIAAQDPWAKQSSFTTDLEVTAFSEESLSVKLESKPLGAQIEPPPDGHVVPQQGMPLVTERELGNLTSKLQDSSLASPDEGVVSDISAKGKKVAFSSSLAQSLITEDENREQSNSKMCRSDSVDSASSDRSDSDIYTNGVRMRKSCLRRTSSTCSEDSEEFDYSGPLSPESPGKKNVRFNLNHNVRVFSNKKDKKRWKMGQRLKEQKEGRGVGSVSPSGSVSSNGSIPESGEGVKPKVNGKSRKDSESSADEEWTCKQTSSSLSNTLIFELDD
ncbi:protein kintoun-like isoform X2 [Nematostella vectensis]|uniref:protein kintoun-like isoform X2 n=1 Tax=Nematostella vectensis TaxID=45351 RepID=UPI0020776B8D|nr:protein kintoun-like isoform X2 [Nematostella vectensis]